MKRFRPADATSRVALRRQHSKHGTTAALYADGVMVARACLEVVAIACRAADISGNQCRGDVSLARARQKAAGRGTKSHLASDALDATPQHNKEEERNAADPSERHKAADTMSQVINGKPAAPLAAPPAAQGPFNGRELAAYLKQCERAGMQLIRGAAGLSFCTDGCSLPPSTSTAWSSVVEASNNPTLPASGATVRMHRPAVRSQRALTVSLSTTTEKPEMFRAPAGPGGAWASGAGGAWGASRPNAQRDQQMADGQPFLVGLARAVDAQRKQQLPVQSQSQSHPKQSKK